MRAARVALALFLLLTPLAPAKAEEPAPAVDSAPAADAPAPADDAAAAPTADPVRIGQVFLEANCSGCHAIGLHDTGLNPEAPPFREIVRIYPPEDLAEAFGEGISTGHPDMPEFELTPDQIDGLIAYLDTLLPPS